MQIHNTFEPIETPYLAEQLDVMNRHIENLLKEKADIDIVRCALNDRRALLQPCAVFNNEVVDSKSWWK